MMIDKQTGDMKGITEIVVDDSADRHTGETDDLTRMVFDLFHEYESSDHRKVKLDEYKLSRESYDGHRPTKEFPWKNCSNYSMMVHAIVVDDMEPRLASQLIGSGEDIIEVLPLSEQMQPHVKAVEMATEGALTELIKWKELVPRIVHEALMAPTVFIKPRYDEKTVKQKQRYRGPAMINPLDGNRITSREEAELLLRNGVMPQEAMVDVLEDKTTSIFRIVNDIIPLNDAYGPDIVTDWDETPFMVKIRPIYKDLERQSVENGGVYINITPEILADESEQRDEDGLPVGADRTMVKPSEQRREIECIECYLPDIALEEGDEPDWVILTYTMQSRTLIRKQYMREVYCNNRKSIKRLMLFPDGDCLHGKTLYSKIEHHCKAINDLLNQMIDSGTVQILPWFFYDPVASGLVKHEVEVYPGAMNPCTDPSKVQQAQVDVKAQVFIEFINVIMSFLERLVSVTSYADGIQDTAMAQGAGTASGMRMLLNETNVKHSYQIKPIREQLADLIEIDMRLLGWFMPADTKIRAKGEFMAVDPMLLQGEYAFNIRISDSASNEMLARMEAVELFNLASKVPFANQAEIFKDLLAAYQKKQPEKYINPAFLIVMQAVAQDPQIVQHIQQVMQQQAQQNKMAEMNQQVEDQLIKRSLMDAAEARKIKAKNYPIVTPGDIEAAIGSLAKNQAKDMVEAHLNPGIDRG